MSDAATPAGVPDDYPGRIVGFPDGVSHLVHGLYGVQSRDAAAAAAFIATFCELCVLPDGPRHLERGRYRDAAGFDCEIMLAYWTDTAAEQRWRATPDVQAWWLALPLAGSDTGYWREVLMPAKERFQYAAGVEDPAGSSAILPLIPCRTFGYWGAYRDRLPASHHDRFASPLAEVPAPRVHDTRGRRLAVRVPDNLCYIREGQGWEHCGADEQRVWDEQMAPVLDQWVAFLGADPIATGCLSIRDCQELDVATGKPNARRSQLAFLLSLGHIEHAARTEPTHLAVHRRFIAMYTEPRFTPRMHVWVEVLIVKHDELVTEYVNCHPDTGLLPFFDVVALN